MAERRMVNDAERLSPTASVAWPELSVKEVTIVRLEVTACLSSEPTTLTLLGPDDENQADELGSAWFARFPSANLSRRNTPGPPAELATMISVAGALVTAPAAFETRTV